MVFDLMVISPKPARFGVTYAGLVRPLRRVGLIPLAYEPLSFWHLHMYWSSSRSLLRC